MKRRGFFGALAGAAAGTAVAAETKSQPTAEDLWPLPEIVHYGGFKIRWTGWKPGMQSLEMAGQWIAMREDGSPIVSTQFPWGADGITSSFPGGVAYWLPGMEVDVCWREEQMKAVAHPREEHWCASLERSVAAQRMALADLKKFIRENC